VIHTPLIPYYSTSSFCEEAWALRIINSQDVYIYSADFYSFFQHYDQTCVPEENCQEKILETAFSQSIWIYNIFTKGVVEIASPDGYVVPLHVGMMLTDSQGYSANLRE
jgi:glucan 1,3-beta-glucosidase